MSFRRTVFAVGTVMALATGCSPTETQLHHVAYEAPRAPIFKMVVFAANMTPGDRQAVENGLAADLRKRGVDARAAYSIFPDTPTEQQDARDAILDQGYEAVLRVNLENIDTTVIETDEHDFHWTVVNIKTSLWDAGTDQLVWSAETRTKNPANERDLAKSISAVLLPALTKAQLILPVRPPHGT